MNKKHIMLVAPFEDKQTGEYIYNTLLSMGYSVAPFDFVREMKAVGEINMNKRLIDVYNNELDPKPFLIIILKGVPIRKETITELKKESKVVIWIYDVTLNGIPVQDATFYVNKIKEVDYYFTSMKGSVSPLKEKGVNAIWLPEAYKKFNHREVPANYYELSKYGADITFCGTIGTEHYHTERIPLLQLLEYYFIDYKIYGQVLNIEKIPEEIKNRHTKLSVINDKHNIVVGASKINLGIEGWTDVEESYSARLYRVMAAGGLYLTTYVKGIENTFKINKKGEEITENQHLVVYYDKEDCIQKIRYLLKNKELRKKIAENGKKEVLEKHEFTSRMEKLLEIVNENGQ